MFPASFPGSPFLILPAQMDIAKRLAQMLNLNSGCFRLLLWGGEIDVLVKTFSSTVWFFLQELTNVLLPPVSWGTSLLTPLSLLLAKTAPWPFPSSVWYPLDSVGSTYQTNCHLTWGVEGSELFSHLILTYDIYHLQWSVWLLTDIRHIKRVAPFSS